MIIEILLTNTRPFLNIYFYCKITAAALVKIDYKFNLILVKKCFYIVPQADLL
jgi:hypothetical protein